MFNFHYSKYLILDLIFLYVPRPMRQLGASAGLEQLAEGGGVVEG